MLTQDELNELAQRAHRLGHVVVPVTGRVLGNLLDELARAREDARGLRIAADEAARDTMYPRYDL